MRSALLVGGSGVVCLALGLGLVVACSSSRDGFVGDPADAAVETGVFEEGGADSGPVPEEPTRDPETCEEAKTTKSYVGCDYWPTVTANPVWKIFDFVAVVANAGAKEANVTVTGPSGTNKQVVVPAGQTRKVYLPWVESLKGADSDACGKPPFFDKSVVEPGGAFHLVSSVPVIVYQFNALEYQGVGGEGPGGAAKDWSTCPGSAEDCSLFTPAQKIGCFSFSNDASLLLPSTAMTGNYRVSGLYGWTEDEAIFGPTLTITATQAGTDVTVTLSSRSKVRASQGTAVPATNGGQALKVTLANAGDVLELASEKGNEFDFSGSLVQASKPIQVISGVPCISLPKGKRFCDHVEEAVLPAETLGKAYVVAMPTGAKGTAVRQNVRLFGNKDATTLTYKPRKPPGCPNTLSAGEVADCALVQEDFEVTGSNEFAVATFLLSAQEIDAKEPRGDPSASTVAALEQFRTKYVFLAPDDYSVNYADITATADATVEIDGKPVSSPWTKIGNGPFGVYREPLGPGQDGAHLLTSKKAVGVQIIGYGNATSYQYPAGLNLRLIAPPPPPPK